MCSVLTSLNLFAGALVFFPKGYNLEMIASMVMVNKFLQNTLKQNFTMFFFLTLIFIRIPQTPPPFLFYPKWENKVTRQVIYKFKRFLFVFFYPKSTNPHSPILKNKCWKKIYVCCRLWEMQSRTCCLWRPCYIIKAGVWATGMLHTRTSRIDNLKLR